MATPPWRLNTRRPFHRESRRRARPRHGCEHRDAVDEAVDRAPLPPDDVGHGRAVEGRRGRDVGGQGRRVVEPPEAAVRRLVDVVDPRRRGAVLAPADDGGVAGRVARGRPRVAPVGPFGGDRDPEVLLVVDGGLAEQATPVEGGPRRRAHERLLVRPREDRTAARVVDDGQAAGLRPPGAGAVRLGDDLGWAERELRHHPDQRPAVRALLEGRGHIAATREHHDLVGGHLVWHHHPHEGIAVGHLVRCARQHLHDEGALRWTSVRGRREQRHGESQQEQGRSHGGMAADGGGLVHRSLPRRARHGDDSDRPSAPLPA